MSLVEFKKKEVGTLDIIASNFLELLTFDDSPNLKAFAYNVNSKNIQEKIQLGISLNYYCTTKGNFAMHDLFLHLLSDFEKADVWISTFSMTELSARVLAKAVESGKVGNLHLLMDKDSKKRYPAVYQVLHNITPLLGLTNIHAKIMVVSDGLKSYTVIGSANWTKNPRIETFLIECNLLTAVEYSKVIANEINLYNGING